jgi:hypothetical protein
MAGGINDKSVSIIIEWENAILAAGERPYEMLRRLASQIETLKTGCEVIIVYDAAEVSEAALREALTRSFVKDVVKPLPVDGKHYYEKKNVGAAHAKGDILIFLDSDVIPEEGWLQGLTDAFDDPLVGVVAGSTYLEPTDLYSKAVAAFWFFPPREEGNELVAAETLFGNNIAFRRDLFLSHRFPEVPQFRGQCGMLIKQLRDCQVPIFLQQRSRCAHPAPNGLRHFIRRALCEGHDNVIIAQRTLGHRRVPMKYTYWSVRSWIAMSVNNIGERYRKLGLTPQAAMVAAAVATSYVCFMVVGEMLSRVNPQIVRRHFAI